MISLRPVTMNDCSYLYKLLEQRDPKINIHHKVLPTFEEHCQFVERQPYEHWMIIEFNGHPIGSTNVTKDGEIGIFLENAHKSKGYGTVALKLMMEQAGRKRYVANVAPYNMVSQEFFVKQGYKLIQMTYAWETA